MPFEENPVIMLKRPGKLFGKHFIKTSFEILKLGVTEFIPFLLHRIRHIVQ